MAATSIRAPIKSKSYEERLRDKNPGLQELWDQYQMLLKIIASGDPNPPRDLVEEILLKLRTRNTR